MNIPLRHILWLPSFFSLSINPPSSDGMMDDSQETQTTARPHRCTVPRSCNMTPLRSLGGQVSSLPRASRMVLACASAILVLIFTYNRSRIRGVPSAIIQQHVVKESGGTYRIPKGRPPSVNLVVAATSREDYSWVKHLRVPELVVIPYIADNISAPHHAQKNKGHEAMIYHQYFYDFYDNLPDISILIHSHQQSWHVDQLLEQDS